MFPVSSCAVEESAVQCLHNRQGGVAGHLNSLRESHEAMHFERKDNSALHKAPHVMSRVKASRRLASALLIPHQRVDNGAD